MSPEQTREALGILTEEATQEEARHQASLDSISKRVGEILLECEHQFLLVSGVYRCMGCRRSKGYLHHFHKLNGRPL